MNTVVSKNRPGGVGDVWLGGACGTNCAAGGGSWVWEDGEPWLYKNWISGAPNNVGGNEGCLHMYSDGSGYWNDVQCSSSMLYVCQVLPPPKTCSTGT